MAADPSAQEAPRRWPDGDVLPPPPPQLFAEAQQAAEAVLDRERAAGASSDAVLAAILADGRVRSAFDGMGLLAALDPQARRATPWSDYLDAIERDLFRVGVDALTPDDARTWLREWIWFSTARTIGGDDLIEIGAALTQALTTTFGTMPHPRLASLRDRLALPLQTPVTCA